MAAAVAYRRANLLAYNGKVHAQLAPIHLPAMVAAISWL